MLQPQVCKEKNCLALPVPQMTCTIIIIIMLEILISLCTLDCLFVAMQPPHPLSPHSATIHLRTVITCQCLRKLYYTCGAPNILCSINIGWNNSFVSGYEIVITIVHPPPPTRGDNCLWKSFQLISIHHKLINNSLSQHPNVEKKKDLSNG